MLDKTDAIFGISETWLEESTPSHLVKLDGYNFERWDRTWGEGKTGGGVGVYIRDDLAYSATNYAHLNVNSKYIRYSS